MVKYFTPNNFRLSSSAFAWGKLTLTRYSTGCYRKILLQSQDIRDEIPEKYTVLGEMNEDEFETELLREYQREVPFKGCYSDVSYTGHADFIVEDYKKIVYELKSADSDSTFYAMVRGEYKPENLAQLVSYMLESGSDLGVLRYDYYPPENRPKRRRKTRAFRVKLSNRGRIIVDGNPTAFRAQDVLTHRLRAMGAIRNSNILERPHNWDKPWNSPCTFCEFRTTCNLYDMGKINSTQEFFDSAKQSLMEKANGEQETSKTKV